MGSSSLHFTACAAAQNNTAELSWHPDPFGLPKPWEGAAGSNTTSCTQPLGALDFTPPPPHRVHPMGAQATFTCCGRKGEAGAEPAASLVAPPQPGTQPSPKLLAMEPCVPAAAWQTSFPSFPSAQVSWGPAQLPGVRVAQQDGAAVLSVLAWPPRANWLPAASGFQGFVSETHLCPLLPWAAQGAGSGPHGTWDRPGGVTWPEHGAQSPAESSHTCSGPAACSPGHGAAARGHGGSACSAAVPSLRAALL